ncbi:MAG TPA: outer membrane beta-barrel protein [Bacteroidales bacterium]|nr:outer membrane beta-barrel protein [Bacteroidales bacterium]
MVDRGANIDVVFRNGLKDYEVLPPADVWDKIRPAVRKNQKPVIILRAAAMIAVLISLSFLAYKWSTNLSASLGSFSFAINPESETPGALVPAGGTYSDAASTFIAKQERQQPVSDIGPDIPIANDNQVSPIFNTIEPENGPSLKGNNLKNKNSIIPLEKSFTGQYIADPFLPELSSEIPEKTVGDRWTIAALVSPTYYSGFNSDHNALTSLLVSKEQPIISYTGGVAFAYKINKRLSVQSGLYYSSLGNELSGISSFSGFETYDKTKGDHNFEVLTTNGTVFTSNSDVFLIDKISAARISTRYTSDVFDPTKANLKYLDNSLTQNFSYLELPLFLKYKLVDKTLGFDLIGGLSSNFLVNNAVYSSLNGGKYQVGKTEGVNTLTFSSSLGMGMEYSFGKNLSLNFEPTFRYYINPFTGAEGMRVHPYSFGIFSGLSYKF